MFADLSQSSVFVLAEVSIKALVLYGTAILILRMSRSLSVHAQHRAWNVVLLIWLFMPLVVLAGLSWSLPVASWKSGLALADVSPPETSPAMINLADETPSNREAARIDVPHKTNSTADQYPMIDLSVVSPAAPGGNLSTASIEESSANPEIAASSIEALLPALYQTMFVAWGAGVIAMLARLAYAMRRTRQICQRTRVLQEVTLPRGVDVRESDDVSSPVVIGWWRPCILLPAEWREWTASKRQAVLAHEQSHLRRGDAIVCFLSELLTVFYWFHPLSWSVKRRLSQLAELACDEAAALETGDRFLYAQHLIEIASAIPSTVRYPAGIAMARSSEISLRVRSLLNVSRPLTSRASLTSLAVILMLGVPSALLIAAVEPGAAPQAKEQPADIPPPPPLAKEAPVPAVPVVAANAVANPPPFENPVFTLRGTAYLPDGTVAKDAVIEQSQFQKERSENRIVSATISEGNFEIKIAGSESDRASLLLRTPDGQAMTTLNTDGPFLRTEYATPRKVIMSPAKTIRVHVTDDQSPVGNATVQLESGGCTFIAKSNQEGVATIDIPKDKDVFVLSAWTEDHKIDGLIVFRRPLPERTSTEFHMRVSKTAPVKVRVVDSQKQPVAGVPVRLNMFSIKHSELGLGGEPTLTVTSDQNGEAVFQWLPNWEERYLNFQVARHCGWMKVGREVKELPDGTRQLEVAPTSPTKRVAVVAQVAGVVSDVSGMLIRLGSFQGEGEGGYEDIQVRTDAQGRFIAHVLPGSTYSAHVYDNELVSNFWHGMIVDWNGQVSQKPAVSLIQGVPVEIRLTKGPDQQPIKDGVWLETSHSYDVRNRDGSLGGASGMQHYYGRPNDQGIAKVNVAPGKVTITANDSDWSFKQTIDVVSGKPAKVHIHHKYADDRTIKGKLVLPTGVTADLSNTSVKIVDRVNDSVDPLTVTSDAEGNFMVKTAAERVSIFATSPGEKFFGGGIVDIHEGPIEVPTYPTVSYQGRVVGSNHQPLSNINVHMMGRLKDRPQDLAPDAEIRGYRVVEMVTRRTVTTDESGRFVFPNTPQLVDLQLSFTQAGETEAKAYRKVYLEPGKTLPTDDVRIRTTPRPAPRSKRPLDQVIPETVLESRLEGIHTLVIVSGTGDKVDPFLGTHINDPETPNDSDAYNLHSIDGPAAEAAPDRKEYFASHNWAFPAKDAAFLVALDGEGKELGRLSVDLTDEPTAAKEVTAFLKQNRTPQVNAQAGFEAALAEAKKSGRRLWVRVGQTRYGSCFRFSYWLDEHKDVLAKDYVMFKFDNIIDLHGQDLRKTLKLDRKGIPCHAIYDADGKELINSVGPQGNIGCPLRDPRFSIDPVTTRHFRKMLETTAQKINAAEIDELVRSLDRE